MAKAKKEKMEANPFKLKKELPLLPGISSSFCGRPLSSA